MGRAKGGKRSKGGKRKKGALQPVEGQPLEVPYAESQSSVAALAADAPPAAEFALNTEAAEVSDAAPALEGEPVAEEQSPPDAPAPEFLGDGLKDESAIDSPYSAPIETIAPETVSPSSTPRYAGLLRRSAALMFDSILLALIDICVLGYLLGRFTWDFIQPLAPDRPDPFSDPERVQQTVIALACLALFNWLYFVACECSPLRRTFGMAVFNARLMRLKPDGTLSTRVSFSRANLRSLGRVLTTLTLGIGFVTSLASKRRQALQDRVSQTVVVVE